MYPILIFVAWYYFNLNTVFTYLMKDIILIDLYPEEAQNFLEYVLSDIFVWMPVF